MKKTQPFNISRLLSFIHALSATLTLMSFWWWGLTVDVPPIFAWGAESRAIGSGGCVVQIIHRNHYVFTRSPPSIPILVGGHIFICIIVFPPTARQQRRVIAHHRVRHLVRLWHLQVHVRRGLRGAGRRPRHVRWVAGPPPSRTSRLKITLKVMVGLEGGRGRERLP